MNKLIREPLLHFLVLGTGLFGLFHIASEDGPSENTIVVTEGKIKQLTALFEKTWQRAPSDAEREALVSEHIREEVLYREGMDMGLDEDDTVIKRRIRQKFEYFMENLSEQSNPSDEDLQTYMTDHAAMFKQPAAYSFRQVYLNPQTHGTNITAKIDELKQLLTEQNIDASQMGDRTLLKHANGNMQTQQVNLAYGRRFMDELSQQATAQWVGAITSTFGVHMVIIDEKTDEVLPPLNDIRDKVVREWENSVREEARDMYFKSLEAKYEIILPE